MVKSFWRKFCISDKAQCEYYDYIDELFSKYSKQKLQREYTLSNLRLKPLTMLTTILVFIITVLVKIDFEMQVLNIIFTSVLLFSMLIVMCMIISSHNQAMIQKDIAEKYFIEKSKVLK